MPSDLIVEVNDAKVQALIDQAPRVYSSEFNRGFRTTMSEFVRIWSKERLRRGGIRVRRRIAFKGTKLRGGSVSIPAKARALGFGGMLRERDRLNGKTVVVRTRSPVAISHEEGAVIRPKKGKYLFVRVRSAASARRAGVKIKRGQKPKVLRVRKVEIPARLRFMASFRRFIPRAKQRLFDTLKRAGERTVAKANRARERAEARRRRRLGK